MRYWPFLITTLAILLDQVSKTLLLDVMLARDCQASINGLLTACEPIALTSWFNLVMVWNTGVSFGMFSSADGSTRYILGILNLVVAAGLLIWLFRAKEIMLRLALALVAGGAVGNAIDRFVYGAVADFFDVYLSGSAGQWAFSTFGTNHWPAFNIADMAIFCGVIGLLLDSLFGGGDRSKRTS